MMSAGAAWIVRDILESGGHPDRPFYESGNQGRRLAWKTGTSFGFRDAWSVGVTDRWTIGVWVGRRTARPIRAFRRQCGGAVAAGHRRGPAGRRAAARIRPATVQAVVTCWPLGYRLGSGPTEACPEQRAAWALNDTVPPSFAGYADVTQGRCAWAACRPGRCCGPCRAAGRWRWTWTRRAPKVRYGGCWMAGSLIMARRLIRLN